MICIIYLLWDRELTLLKKIILLPMDLSLMQASVDGSFDTWHHGGTWFISCLFFCYVLSPFIVSVLQTISPKGCIVLAGGLGAVDAYMELATHIMQYSSIYSSMIFRAMEFIIGMCLAKLCVNSKSDDSRNWTKAAFLAVVLTGGISVLSFLGGSFRDYGFFAIPVFCLILKYSAFSTFEKGAQKIVQSRAFAYANKIAYEFFLAQFFCFKITNRMSLHSSFLKTIVAFFVCVIIAIILHEVISIPGQKVLSQVYLKISNTNKKGEVL